MIQKPGVLILVLLALASSCSKDDKDDNGSNNGGNNNISNTFTDTRDGKVYKTVNIGNQVWMAENLNYDTIIGSWCYDSNSGNCIKYGRLYDWQTALSVCPAGWHLPSKNEFETLLSNVGGGGTIAYHALKDGSSSGFNALFGGWRFDNGGFNYIGVRSNWWSSSEHDIHHAWNLDMYSLCQNANTYYLNKKLGFSVRCLRDM